MVMCQTDLPGLAINDPEPELAGKQHSNKTQHHHVALKLWFLLVRVNAWFVPLPLCTGLLVPPFGAFNSCFLQLVSVPGGRVQGGCHATKVSYRHASTRQPGIWRLTHLE